MNALRLFPSTTLQSQLPKEFAAGFPPESSVNDLYTALGCPERFEVEYGWPYDLPHDNVGADVATAAPGVPRPQLPLPSFPPASTALDDGLSLGGRAMPAAAHVHAQLPAPGAMPASTAGSILHASSLAPPNPMDGLAPPTFLGDISLGFSNFGVSDAPVASTAVSHYAAQGSREKMGRPTTWDAPQCWRREAHVPDPCLATVRVIPSLSPYSPQAYVSDPLKTPVVCRATPAMPSAEIQPRPISFGSSNNENSILGALAMSSDGQQPFTFGSGLPQGSEANLHPMLVRPLSAEGEGGETPLALGPGIRTVAHPSAMAFFPACM